MAKVKENHIVRVVDNTIRINDYLIDVFQSLPSKKSIKKALKKGLILVDGKSVSSALWIKPEMHIELIEDSSQERQIYPLDLDVRFEDDYFAIVVKPAGLVSSGNQFRTLQNAVAGVLQTSPEIDAISPPRLVHRLDSSTSGLLIVAKTAHAVKKFGDMLANNEIKKKYLAFVIGELDAGGFIDKAILEKDAKTKYECIETIASDAFGHLSRVQLYPTTGRTHQLRIHMADNNTPILGDLLYGDKEKDLKGKGLFLSAIGLEFSHPFTDEQLKVEIPSPKKFEKYWKWTLLRNSFLEN
jgi:23S rRNA pseudouridine1911/1915/1917 synthase